MPDPVPNCSDPESVWAAESAQGARQGLVAGRVAYSPEVASAAWVLRAIPSPAVQAKAAEQGAAESRVAELSWLMFSERYGFWVRTAQERLDPREAYKRN